MNKTAIEWTDFSASPIKFRDTEGRAAWGCIKASAGCQNCYAEAISRRYRGPGAGFTAKRMEGLTPYVDEAELKAMLSPRRLPAGSKVFVGDMTDIFGPWVPFEMLDRLFAVMALRSDVVFQVLTKRPERMREYLEAWVENSAQSHSGSTALDLRWDAARKFLLSVLTKPEHYRSMGIRERVGVMMAFQRWPLPNVWLGTSAEDQAAADVRIPELLACPAAVRFVSAEPLLGPVNFDDGEHSCFTCDGSEPTDEWCLSKQNGWAGGHFHGVDWVIVGGESGPGARPCDIGWIRSTVGQCKAAGTAVFVKQVGSRPYFPADCDCEGEHGNHRTAGRLKDRKGGDMAEWPADLRVREMPR